MVQGWQYRRSLAKGRDVGIVEAEAYVRDDQSTVLKYVMGDRRNVRLPGDVGLAQDRILLSHWKHLAMTQGIRPNRSHDLPGRPWRASFATRRASTLSVASRAGGASTRARCAWADPT
jgi:hypothetical protein